MRYTAWPRVSTYQDTPPSAPPWRAPQQHQRDKLPLLAALIAEEQPAIDTEIGTPQCCLAPATGTRARPSCPRLAPRQGAPGHPGSGNATSNLRPLARVALPGRCNLSPGAPHALRAGQGRPGRGGRLRAKQARSGSLPHLRCCHSDRAAVPLGPKARPKPGPVRRLSPALPEQSAWRFGPLAQQGQGTPRGLTALGDPAGPPRAQTVPVRPRRTPTPRAVRASGLGPAQGRACLDRARGETAGTGAGGPRARAKGPRP